MASWADHWQQVANSSSLFSLGEKLLTAWTDGQPGVQKTVRRMIKRRASDTGGNHEREGAVQSGEEMAWWDFTHMYKFLMERVKRNEIRLLSVEFSDRTRGHKLKQKKFDKKKLCYAVRVVMYWSGLYREAVNSTSLEISKNWSYSHTTCSNWSCSGQEVGLGKLQNCPLNSSIVLLREYFPINYNYSINWH